MGRLRLETIATLLELENSMNGLGTIIALNQEAQELADVAVDSPAIYQIGGVQIEEVLRMTGRERLLQCREGLNVTKGTLLKDLQRINDIISGRRYFDYDLQQWVED